MYNKQIVLKVKDILPEYRYNIIRDFYNKCNKVHSEISKKALDTAIDKNFEEEFTLDITFTVPEYDLYDYTNSDDFTTENLPIYVKYINEDNDKYVVINLDDTALTIYLNTNYVTEYFDRYDKAIRTDLFYLEYCMYNHIHIDNLATYILNLVNDINISDIDFYFIKKMILLISPSERLTRVLRVLNDINSLTNKLIDIMCYGLHGIKRICCLINYVMNDCYYNMFHFFLFHFMDEDIHEIKPLLYLGYFLTKLNIKNFGINKEYIGKILNINYQFTKADINISREIYSYFDNYFNEYIYDFYKTIDTVLEEKNE